MQLVFETCLQTVLEPVQESLLNIYNILELSGFVYLEGLVEFFSAWGTEKISGL